MQCRMERSWFYYFGRWLTRFSLRLLTDWEVQGKENVPDNGPLLIVANHMNNADPPLIAVSVPRKTVFMSKEELFHHWLTSYFISRFGAFPVHREKIDIAIMRRVKEYLEADWALVMFPEGMRSHSGGMLPAFPGSALIAVKNNVSILPVGIIGTEKMVGKTWFYKRPKIIVKIGKPFTLPRNGKVSREELTELTDMIMYHIAELLPEKYHGCYAGRIVKDANRKVS